jgi:hypothetical protein
LTVASGLIYAPLQSAAYSALSGYDKQSGQTVDWLKQIMASNQAAQKSIMDAKAQQMQSSQEAVPAEMGLKGAQIGGMFGPIGAGVGAAAGGLLGAGSDFSNRMTHGEGFLSSVGHSLWDVVNPVNLVHALTGAGGTEAAAGVASGLKKAQTSKGSAMKSAASSALSDAAFGPGKYQLPTSSPGYQLPTEGQLADQGAAAPVTPPASLDDSFQLQYNTGKRRPY